MHAQPGASAAVRVVELAHMGSGEWDALIDGEREPFGGGPAEAMTWRQKTRRLGVIAADGSLLGAAGLVRAEVLVGGERIAVAGIGGVIVTRRERGRGLARMLMERALEIAPELEVERAMLFCLEARMAMYERFGFLPIATAVLVRQRGGAVAMPLAAMWRPLRDGASWPPGAVEVLGEPF